MLSELRRPIRIDDWNQLVVEFNNLEKKVIELEERTKELEPEPVVETLVFDREFNSPNDFFREDCSYTFPFQVTEDIEDIQQYQLLKNIYVFDKEIRKAIEDTLKENKLVHLVVNIDEEEKSKKKVVIKDNTAKVNKGTQGKKRGRPRKKKDSWF